MLDVAKEILRQLGGNQFIAMTGASYFLGAKDGLMFKIPGSMTKDGINSVKITLDSSDLYVLSFTRVWGNKVVLERNFDMVHADSLQRLFTSVTGLDCGGIR